MVGIIVVVSALLSCVLFASVCNFMNVQRALIREFILYEFKHVQNFVEATKNIACEKSEWPSWSLNIN